MTADTPDRAALAESLQEMANAVAKNTPPEMAHDIVMTLTEAAAALKGSEVNSDLGFGYCPVQIEGTHNNRRYYFRARGSHFSLCIGSEGDFSEFAGVAGPEVLRGEIATEFAAGYMPHQLARDLVEWALVQREGVLDAPTPPAPALPLVLRGVDGDPEVTVTQAEKGGYLAVLGERSGYGDTPMDALAHLARACDLAAAPALPPSVAEAVRPAVECWTLKGTVDGVPNQTAVLTKDLPEPYAAQHDTRPALAVDDDTGGGLVARVRAAAFDLATDLCDPSLVTTKGDAEDLITARILAALGVQP